MEELNYESSVATFLLFRILSEINQNFAVAKITVKNGITARNFNLYLN
jgi:hypothetical protein